MTPKHYKVNEFDVKLLYEATLMHNANTFWKLMN